MLPVPLLVILSRLNAVALRVASGESEAAPSEEEGFCRLSNMGYLGLAEFRSRACGFCFAYTFTSEDRHHAKPRVCHDGVIFCPPHCLCPEEAAASSLPPPTLYNLPDFAPTQRNTTIPFPKNLHKFYPPVKPGYLHHLGKCCTAAVECCKRHKVRNLTEHHLLTEGECVATWDGWDCFSTTAPGTHVTQSCPDYIYETEQSAIQKSQLKLLKKCGTDGSWERNVHTGLEWTDYAGCIAFDVKLEQTKLIVAVCAFFLSVLAILPALFIFTHFRSLACPSVRIHRQLLLSLLASSLIYIFNALFFILPGGPGAYMVPRNHVFCRVMFSLQLRYFRLTTYMWMFCEGWYLHRLLVAAFDDQTNLVGYYLFGWAFPLLPTLADFVLRLVYEESSKCWVDLERKHIEWVYQAPCLLSLSINFLLMIKIVVILVQKLQYSSTMEPTQYRKAVRGTLILIPMFGLQFFLTIYRMNLFAYKILNVLIDGLQGFVVSIIICYTNNRVVEELSRRWAEHRLKAQIRRESLHRLRSHGVSSPKSSADHTRPHKLTSHVSVLSHTNHSTNHSTPLPLSPVLQHSSPQHFSLTTNHQQTTRVQQL